MKGFSEIILTRKLLLLEFKKFVTRYCLIEKDLDCVVVVVGVFRSDRDLERLPFDLGIPKEGKLLSPHALYQ